MWERCCVFLSQNNDGQCDWKVQQLSKDESVYNCITQKLSYRYCTRVAYMKNYCQGEGLMVAFARSLGDLPCAALTSSCVSSPEEFGHLSHQLAQKRYCEAHDGKEEYRP